MVMDGGNTDSIAVAADDGTSVSAFRGRTRTARGEGSR
jgi:hypothetical protein